MLERICFIDTQIYADTQVIDDKSLILYWINK